MKPGSVVDSVFIHFPINTGSLVVLLTKIIYFSNIAVQPVFTPTAYPNVVIVALISAAYSYC